MTVSTERGRYRLAKWGLGGLAFLLLLGFSVLSYFMGGPRDAYGFLRYALPQWHEGELQVGHQAPDVELVGLDGAARFRLREKIGLKPLVLIFGSYT